MAKSTDDRSDAERQRDEHNRPHESEAARRAAEAETSPASPATQPARVKLRWFGGRDDARLQTQEGTTWYDVPTITAAQAEADRAAELAQAGPVATNPFQPGAPGVGPTHPGGPAGPQVEGAERGAAEPSQRDRRD